MAFAEQDMVDIYNAVGLPEQCRTEDQVGHLLSAVACTFLDTEVTYGHNPMEQERAEWFGTQNYNDGKFVPTLLRLYEGNDAALHGKIDGLAHLAGIFVARQLLGESAFSFSQFIRREVTMLPAGFALDDRVVHLDRPVQSVVEYGPGMHGKHYIDTQAHTLGQRKEPFTYYALTIGPVVGSVLGHYAAVKLGESNPYFKFNRDGMAAGSDRLLQEQWRTGTQGFADIVIASKVHRADPREIAHAISNAHSVLRPNGALLLRGPLAESRHDGREVSIETMLEYADNAGFDPNRAEAGEFEMRTMRGLAAVLYK